MINHPDRRFVFKAKPRRTCTNSRLSSARCSSCPTRFRLEDKPSIGMVDHRYQRPLGIVRMGLYYTTNDTARAWSEVIIVRAAALLHADGSRAHVHRCT